MDYPLPTFVLCDLFLSVKSGAFLILPLNTGDNKIAHIQFLSETGRLFRSLNLHDFCGVPDINGEASKSIDRLFDILQLCPLLEECTISRALSILASRRKSKYPSLKKLSILGVEHSKSLGFLNSLSLNLPNLCEFSLGFVFYCNRSTNPVVIDMPHSSLDLLTWYEHRSLNYNGDEKTYIKLKTERELRYYSCNRDALLPVNDSRYLLATQNARFDINCKDLKEVKILDEYHGDHYSWIF
ncbi:hypothetical protein HPULCUR_000803 [Helicostylum pulchrum]|uniref:Uncharacterized protein n=1 Tax=Helicostylum pulchrum TaxID=562976 RepID=A0ABP9XM57_9FUNG